MHAKVKKRVAIQEAYSNNETWGAETYWADMKNRIPREVALHLRLSRWDKHDCIIECRSWRPHWDEDERFFRLYSEYAPKANLYGLFRRYAGEKARKKGGGPPC